MEDMGGLYEVTAERKGYNPGPPGTVLEKTIESVRGKYNSRFGLYEGEDVLQRVLRRASL